MDVYICAGIAVTVFTVIAVFYLAPTGIAQRRGHANRDTVYAANVFFGWTVIGWLATLVWAAIGKTENVVVVADATAPHRTSQFAVSSNPVKEVRTRLKAVSRRNADGTDRQNLINSLRTGQQLRLARDRDAVVVCLADGQQVGNLGLALADRAAANLDTDCQVGCTVLDIIGGDGVAYDVDVMLSFHPLHDPEVFKAGQDSQLATSAR